MKSIAIVICAFFAFITPSQAQFLKKIKEKVNKTIDKTTGSGADSDRSSDNSSSASGKDNSTWCDTIKLDVAGGDGVTYSKIYSSEGRMDIIYNESSLGLENDPKGYRLILSERINGKQQFVVVENGKVVDTDTKVKSKYLGKGVSDDFSQDGSNDPRNEEMKKYIIADSTKITTPKTAAKSATIKKVDDDQMTMALEIARQTDDYKSMSAEEKKEFEEMMKKGVQQNNAMAGQTISVPAQQGGSFATITGYKLIVKGKNYGKFTIPPAVEVSKDETKVFAVGLDDKANPVLVTHLKRTALDKNKFNASGGKMIRSADKSKAVYIETKSMNEQEISDVTMGRIKMSYNVLKSDGTSMVITDYGSTGSFTLTNSGTIISVNESTGEVYGDGKKIGKFTLKDGYTLRSDAILMGGDASKLAYYDGSTGSINYLDGSTRKLGVMYPQVVKQDGKSYLNWFRKCKNDIYLAKFEY